ncbi:hypothetical protein FM106_03615 [Brachybacterium faecium]|nr:hypothetical protein FM106_03615 [Brachybacterium faecium]
MLYPLRYNVFFFKKIVSYLNLISFKVFVFLKITLHFMNL